MRIVPNRLCACTHATDSLTSPARIIANRICCHLSKGVGQRICVIPKKIEHEKEKQTKTRACSSVLGVRVKIGRRRIQGQRHCVYVRTHVRMRARTHKRTHCAPSFVAFFDTHFCTINGFRFGICVHLFTTLMPVPRADAGGLMIHLVFFCS